MKLDLSLENGNQSWPLTPDKIYTVGSDVGCNFTLPPSENVRGQHLKFSFDQANNCWLVEDLSGRRGTIVNNMLVANALIKGITRIVISDEVVIIAKPEFSTAPPVAIPVTPPPIIAPTLVAPVPEQAMSKQAWNPPTPNLYHSGSAATPTNSNSFSPPSVPRKEVSSGVSRASAEELIVLTWAQYVQRQIKEHGKNSIGMSWVINFALKTGFRNTPWMKEIDGYIIPNFRGKAESVAIEIERELGFLRQYEETDCYISSMTDAHIADSATQSFLGIELFPIIRSRKHNKGDYRKFCVTSYHRVKAYLLVEKYGDDLFVSWVTRFEPIPSPVSMELLMTLALISSLLLIIPFGSIGIKGLLICALPLLLWWETFFATPAVMSSMKILPKKANAKLVMGIIFFLSLLILLFLLALPVEGIAFFVIFLVVAVFTFKASNSVVSSDKV
jgi:FHA domain